MEDLKLHMKSHAEANSEPFSCQQCDNVFNTDNSLNEHKKSIHPQIISKCNFCSELFQEPGMFDKHDKEVHKLLSCPSKNIDG